MKPDPSVTPALGPVVRTFKPSRANLLAGGVLGILLLAAGGGLGVFAPQLVEKPEGVTLVYAAGAACLTGGLLFLAFTLRLARTRVDLCEGGFRYHSWGRVDEVTWGRVNHIRLHVTAKEGAHVDPSVTVLTEQGEAYHFTANHVDCVPAFVKALGDLTGGHGDLWEVTSQVSRRRMAASLMATGLFLMVYAPLMFCEIARAEQHAGGEPVRVHWVAYTLYQLGGNWLAAAGVFTLGVVSSGWGVATYRRVEPPAFRRRKSKGWAGPAKAASSPAAPAR